MLGDGRDVRSTAVASRSRRPTRARTTGAVLDGRHRRRERPRPAGDRAGRRPARRPHPRSADDACTRSVRRRTAKQLARRDRSRSRSPQLRRPEVRRRGRSSEMRAGRTVFPYERLFVLADPPDYEPAPEHEHRRAGGASRRRSRRARRTTSVLSDDGRGMLYVPFLNYTAGNLDVAARDARAPERRARPRRRRRPRRHDLRRAASRRRCSPTGCATATAARSIDLAHVVANQTSRHGPRRRPARPRRASHRACAPTSTSIDLDRAARCTHPIVAHDLPAGGKRFLQRADGYLHTIVAGHADLRGRRAHRCARRPPRARRRNPHPPADPTKEPHMVMTDPATASTLPTRPTR